MAIHQLENLNAFSPGAQLWIVADQDNSKWSRQVDWQLGFQLSRADGHKSATCAKPLTEMADACGIEIQPTNVSKESSTMVASSPYLPNTYTVKIPFNGNKSGWLNQASHIWQNLTCPSVRLFLPDKMSFEEFKKGWQSKDTANDISVVI